MPDWIGHASRQRPTKGCSVTSLGLGAHSGSLWESVPTKRDEAATRLSDGSASTQPAVASRRETFAQTPKIVSSPGGGPTREPASGHHRASRGAERRWL